MTRPRRRRLTLTEGDWIDGIILMFLLLGLQTVPEYVAFRGDTDAIEVYDDRWIGVGTHLVLGALGIAIFWGIYSHRHGSDPASIK